MSITKKKIRKYLQEYLAIGFIESLEDKLLPYCLLCSKSFSSESMRQDKLTEHFLSLHKKEADFPLIIFELLFSKHKIDRGHIPIEICENKISNESLLEASFYMSLLIAKLGKPHNIQ